MCSGMRGIICVSAPLLACGAPLLTCSAPVLTCSLRLSPSHRFFVRCSSFAHPHAHSHFFRASFACSIVGDAVRGCRAPHCVVVSPRGPPMRPLLRSSVPLPALRRPARPCSLSSALPSLFAPCSALLSVHLTAQLSAAVCSVARRLRLRCRPSVVRLVVGTSLFMWM